MTKILVDKEILNKLLTAIDTHISILTQSNIQVANIDKVQESLNFLIKYRKLIVGNKELLQIKRNAYSRYVALKKELHTLNKGSKEADKKQKEVEKALELYIELKSVTQGSE